ncbi:hypothetical protein [Cupriavidus sp. H18C1]|uniref:hypothetical protein n=1 Tax=Cupriavidus sp. H18C1 TaxID=3241601 RepID=UPI003BB9839E
MRHDGLQPGRIAGPADAVAGAVQQDRGDAVPRDAGGAAQQRGLAEAAAPLQVVRLDPVLSPQGDVVAPRGTGWSTPPGVLAEQRALDRTPSPRGVPLLNTCSILQQPDGATPLRFGGAAARPRRSKVGAAGGSTDMPRARAANSRRISSRPVRKVPRSTSPATCWGQRPA